MFCLRQVAANRILNFQCLPRLVVHSTSSMHSQTRRETLKGKVAIVTAATDGIGFAISRRLAEDGASVVISSRKQENVDKSVEKLQKEGLDVSGIVCHVGKSEDRNNLIDYALNQKGRIDLFVSNAAVNPAVGPLIDCSESAWDKIFDINVKSAFLLAQRIIPEMEKSGGGSIVFISSIGGYRPIPILGAYCVSKTALLGLSKVLASECASINIRVNCVCPGIIKTRFSQMLWQNQEALEVIKQLTPMERVGEPEEIAPIVSFLCSDDAKYITGESIPVAGGYYSRL